MRSCLQEQITICGLIMVPFHGHDIISRGSVDSFSLSVPGSQMSTGLAYANEALCRIVPL